MKKLLLQIYTKLLYLLNFQLQKTRTHYQDQMRLTSHVYKVKSVNDDSTNGNSNNKSKNQKRKASNSEALGLTNLLLIINNWNFVRDTQLQANVKKCAPADFQVQLKLSSTAFRNAANPDCEFPFDKQAANFTYDGFLQLQKSLGLKAFIKEVKETYKALEGNFPDEEDEEEAEDEEIDVGDGENEEDEEVRFQNKKTRRSAVRARADSPEMSDIDSDSQTALETGTVSPPPPQRKRGKRCLPPIPPPAPILPTY